MKAIFAGTFDPFTSGHLNITERALEVFGDVTVAVAAETGGKHAADIERRVHIAKLAVSGLRGVSVDSFDGLLSDYVKNLCPCVLVRGVRTSADLDYETMLTRVYNSLCGVQSVFFIPDAKFEHISSTVVRELAGLNADLTGYAVPGTEESIKELYATERNKGK